ncbi:MAG: T9SS type A sorting domain-containing protein [Balneolales bacterium]|nr:T9SS type A sorting domain-containing protein [Balneolales bacterium]
MSGTHSNVSSVTFRIYAFGDVATGVESQAPGGGLANFDGNFSLGGFNFTVSGVGSDVIVTGTVVGPPEVSSTVASDISATSATIGGEVLADGGGAVLQRGVVWGTSENPTIESGNVAEIGSGLGEFSGEVSKLPFGTTIHYRTFATNSNGTGYSNNNQFQTSSEISLELTGEPGWRLISVPSDVNLSDFLSPIWTQGAAGSDYEPGPAHIFRWPDVSSIDSESWVAVTDLNQPANAGEGLLIYVFQDDDYEAGGGVFPKSLPLNGTEFAPFANVTTNTNAEGFSLLGNPFGSAISFEELFGDANGINGAVYVWDPNDNSGDGGTGGAASGSWKTFSTGTGVGDLTNGKIAPFQGFFVQNTAGAGGVSSVNFQQSAKSADGTFLGKVNQQHKLRVELKGQEMKDAAWLVFNNEGSTNRSIHDALQLSSMSQNYVTASIQKPDGIFYDIAHLQSLYDEFAIPIHFETSKQGTFTVSFSDLELPDYMPLYFTDTQTGSVVRIEDNSTYEFDLNKTSAHSQSKQAQSNQPQLAMSTSNSDNPRFLITTNPGEYTSIEDQEMPTTLRLYPNYPNPFNPVTQIKYDLPESADVRLEVYNTQGQSVAVLINGTQSAGTHLVQFDASSLSS